MCKIDTSWEAVVYHRELSCMLCDDLEGWGRLGREGICIHMADSLCCAAETRILKQLHSNQKQHINHSWVCAQARLCQKCPLSKTELSATGLL